MSNVIKIDIKLKKRIEELLKTGDKRIEYPTVKNFVDKAVLRLLKEVENEGK